MEYALPALAILAALLVALDAWRHRPSRRAEESPYVFVGEDDEPDPRLEYFDPFEEG